MARTWASAVTILRARIRESGTISLSNNNAIWILTIMQQLVNCALQSVTTTESMSVTASTLKFTMASALTTPLDILLVTQSNRKLYKCNSIEEFAAYDVDWALPAAATRLEAWYQLGREEVLFAPVSTSTISVSVTHVKATTVYSDYTTYSTTNAELSDEDLDLAIQLAEMYLTLRHREPAAVKAEIALFLQQIKGKRRALES